MTLLAFLLSLAPFPTLWSPRVYLSALVALVKKEPVRVASFVLAAVLIAVASLTGVSLPVLLGEVTTAVLVLERVRKVVAPLIDVVLHADDVPPGAVPVLFHPNGFDGLPSAPPPSNVSVLDAPPSVDDVETKGDDL